MTSYLHCIADFWWKPGKMQYNRIAMKARHLFIVRARNARLIWMTTYINQWWVKTHDHSDSGSCSLTIYLKYVVGQIHLSELSPSLHYLCEMTINMIITNWVQFICTSFNENSNGNLDGDRVSRDRSMPLMKKTSPDHRGESWEY